VNALSRIDAQGGTVFIEGERWNAVSEVAVEKDQPVEVVGLEGLTLKVKPKAVEPLNRESWNRRNASTI
jgi:membrane-bound serine protease (ClpP class)